MIHSRFLMAGLALSFSLSIIDQGWCSDPVEGLKPVPAREFNGLGRNRPRFVCKPPNQRPPAVVGTRRTGVALPDSTPPTPPGSLQVVTESTHSVFARWQAASDPESAIDSYAFAIGTSAGAADITWWQSTGLSLASYSKSLAELNLLEGSVIHISVRATNTAGLSSDIVGSGPITLQYEPLGSAANVLSVDFAGGWSQAELADLRWFLDRMLPIIKELYGPPSHSYTVTLTKDPAYSSTAVFFSGPNEIHMESLHPQLLTHEIIHAFRDNVVFASDDFWRYEPTLSGFEESFAQGISYLCMNLYAERYPADPIVPANVIYISDYEWDYDFQNTDIVTTTDYWSDGSGTGIFWLRYELGAAAIMKVMKDHPAFARDFNAEYYARLNADHALRSTRSLARLIVSQVAPIIEGRPGAEWIDRQHIFDCTVQPGRKIWLRTQHYPGWSEYLIFQRPFYYETFSNGSEWSYWDAGISEWVYHSLNGSTGRAVLRDWSGALVATKDLLIQPIDNPPVHWGFGNATVNLSTDSDTAPWPNDDPNNYMLNLNTFGLYRLEVTFNSDTTEVYRLMGDPLRSTSGVFGGILEAGDGALFLDHEDYPGEPPLRVENGVFHGERTWASIPNPLTGFSDCRPGRVAVTFFGDDGSELADRRNVDLGSWSGSQVFLFDTREMSPVATGWNHVQLATPNGGESLQPGATATIRWQLVIPHDLQNWDLWYSTTGPNGPWIEIALDVPAGSTAAGSSHSFQWLVPNTPSSQVRVKIKMDNSGADHIDISDTNMSIEPITAVELSNFSVERQAFGVVLRWEVTHATDHLGFHVFRQTSEEPRHRITNTFVVGSRHYEYEDREAPFERTDYWLQESETDGTLRWYGPVTVTSVPKRARPLALAPNFPNPFNPVTRIAYTLPGSGKAFLGVYDTRGTHVRTLVDAVQAAGAHSVEWLGRDNEGLDQPSGIYYLRLKFESRSKQRKIILLK